MTKESLTQLELKEFIAYDSNTGLFTRIKRSSNSVKIGDNAGYLTDNGYFQIRIKNEPHMSHRLAWLYVYGKWPNGQVDHINHLKNDNRMENLRDVSHIENSMNCGLRADNTSGVAGVYWHKSLGKWRSRIYSNKKAISLGVFRHKVDAIIARKMAEYEFGYHKNHGK